MNDIIHNYALNAQLSYAAYADLEGVDPQDLLGLVDALTDDDSLWSKKGDRIIFDIEMIREKTNAKAGENHIKEYTAPCRAAWA